MAVKPKLVYEDRERVWQYYSEDMWNKILIGCGDGQIMARADLRWMKGLFLCDEAIQENLFKKSYSSIASTLTNLYWLKILMAIIAIVCSWFAFEKYAIIYVVLLFLALSTIDKSSIVRPKNWNLLVLYAIGTGAIWFVTRNLPNNIMITVTVAVSFLLFITSSMTAWAVRSNTIELLFSDYEFFKQLSGRPHESGERPPICFIDCTQEDLAVIPWDENDDPPLLDFQVLAPHPTIIGTSYEYFLSTADSRALAVILAFYVAYAFPELRWQVIVTASIVISIVDCYICPSQLFTKYRVAQKKVLSMPDHASIWIAWPVINIIRTIVSVGALSYVAQYALPYITFLK